MLNIKYIKMKNAIRKNAGAIVTMLLVLFLNLSGCKKEELPEKEYWAPQNFWVLDSTAFIKKLTWNYYGPSFIDGFKIDRKVGNSPWVEEYATISVNQRYWLDTNIITYPKTTYEYTIYAFKGTERSAIQSLVTASSFKAPKITSIELSDDETSVMINWEIDYDFEPGFVIDRKFQGDAWIEKYATVEPGSTSFVDSNPYRTDGLNYRIYAVYREFQSERDSTSLRIDLKTPTNPISLRSRINRFEMTWDYQNIDRIDGFKVKRKYADTEWQTIGETNTIHFEDTTFMMNQSVVYGIHAYKGKIESSPVIIEFNSKIPSPENANYTINSLSSVSIHFDLGIEGLDGYTLYRKYENEEWSFVANVSPEIDVIEDNAVFIESCTNNALMYRLTAHYDQFQSDPVIVKLLSGAILDQRDGKIYETVIIGDQCWLRRNMAWLPEVFPPNINSVDIPYYYVLGHYSSNVEEARNSLKYKNYGALYNWSAALLACPEGWRLPNQSDWDELVDFCSGQSHAGEKLKDKSDDYWASEFWAGPGTDDYNFTALPAGGKYPDFNGEFFVTYWWTSEPGKVNKARAFGVDVDHWLWNFEMQKSYGISVRCINE